MTSQPDHLFRDKLTHYQEAPPMAAWERIDANLDKNPGKTSKIVGLAGILVFCLILLFTWQLVNESNNPAPVQEKLQQKIPQINQETPKKELNPIMSPDTSVFGKPKVSKVQTESKKISARKEFANVISPSEIMQPPLTESTLTTFAGALATSPKEDADDQAIPKVKSVKLVYTAKEVQSKYAKKQEASIVTRTDTVSERQTLADIVIAVKTNQTGLGDLRAMKDGLLTFTLNGSKDKTQKNNKR